MGPGDGLEIAADDSDQVVGCSETEVVEVFVVMREL
jgi:hypothetical protein